MTDLTIDQVPEALLSRVVCPHCQGTGTTATVTPIGTPGSADCWLCRLEPRDAQGRTTVLAAFAEKVAEWAEEARRDAIEDDDMVRGGPE